MKWLMNANKNCVRDEMTYECKKKKLCKLMRWLMHTKKIV